MLAHYRRLIALRHDELVVAHGDFHPAPGRRQWLVLGNVSGDVVDVPLPSWAGARVLLSNVDSRGDLVLRPWEARICVRP